MADVTLAADVTASADYQALLRGVLLDPADDLPRLVLADHLEENGEGDRAEYIRLGCEFAKADDSWTPDDPSLSPAEARDRILGRQHELLMGHETVWSKPWRTKAAVRSLRCGGPAGVCCDRDADMLSCDCLANAPDFTWSRGFVSEVTLTLAAFVGGPCPECVRGYVWAGPDSHWCRDCAGTGRVAGCAEALFREHPITQVVLTDREPWEVESPERYVWRPDSRWNPAWPETLPAAIFDRMPVPVYPTRQSALEARSTACVALGRDLAGLPPIGGV